METEKRPRQRIIRKPELLNMIGLSDPTIWRMEKDGNFPKRLRLGGNSCGWLESEVLEWLDNCAAARRMKV
jgi:prophage regulatory protein